MENVEIAGLASLESLSRALRAAGTQGKGLKRELNKGLNRATKPVRKDLRRAILPALPKRGGLARDVSKSTRITTSLSASASNPSVRIKVRGKRSIRRMNTTGSFRHPVFGRAQVPWQEQSVPGLQNFLDRPFEKSRPAVRQAVLSAITQVRSDINRSI